MKAEEGVLRILQANKTVHLTQLKKLYKQRYRK